MVISIDYLCAYDPALSPCILKSTQIIGFSNFMLRERQPAVQNCLYDETYRHRGLREIAVKRNKSCFSAEMWEGS